jgi:Rieske Fe-S protein
MTGEYFLKFRIWNIKEIEKEREAINLSGVKVTGTAAADFPFEAQSLAYVGAQAQFNPLKYVRKLAESVRDQHCRIYEKTKVTSIRDYDPCYVETTGGVIKAKKVVQATHSPKGIYAVHAMMEVYREYAVAAKLKEDIPAGIYWALEGNEKYSIRTYDTPEGKYLIVLGDSKKVGHSQETWQSFQKLENYLKIVFNVDEMSWLWGAQNYSPSDYIPFIGKSPMEDNIYIATGFAADGLVYGTLAAMIISDMIAMKGNPWSEFYNPARLKPVTSAKTLQENADVTAHLIKEYNFKGSEEELAGIGRGEGRIVEFNREKAAAFRDNDDHLHVVSAKCTHMGCIVHWNDAEKSWDCPCHGSRFTIDGEVIEGPAFGNLEKYWRKDSRNI